MEKNPLLYGALLGMAQANALGALPIGIVLFLIGHEALSLIWLVAGVFGWYVWASVYKLRWSAARKETSVE